MMAMMANPEVVSATAMVVAREPTYYPLAQTIQQWYSICSRIDGLAHPQDSDLP
jgi:hypothetical protein